MITQHDINQKQYQNKSLDYLNSQAHSEGIEFNKFINEIQKIEKAVVLDLGCGGGMFPTMLLRMPTLFLLTIYLMKC